MAAFALTAEASLMHIVLEMTADARTAQNGLTDHGFFVTAVTRGRFMTAIERKARL